MGWSSLLSAVASLLWVLHEGALSPFAFFGFVLASRHQVGLLVKVEI